MTNFEKKKILILEDHTDLAFLYGLYFPELEYDVKIGYNGEEGISLVESFSPDVIIVDIQMPKIDGYGFLQHLQKNNICAKTIVLSGFSEVFHKEKCTALGVSLDIEKSAASPEKIITAVESLLK